MTRRKPPNMTFPGWIERQIRTAEAEGAFADLPGAGKPIPDLGRAHDDLAWLADYLRRENVDVVEVLPPNLALAKEVDTIDERLLRVRSESHARAVLDELNQRIDEAYARPQIGPPLRVKRVNVEAALERRRQALAALAPPPPPTVEPERARRRLWRRRSRPEA
jgi:Domain of unknown function (DUF1992)